MNPQTLETQTLVDTMEERARHYETLREQFYRLRGAFQNIVNLNEFKGQGADAIKGFYQAQIQVVDEWIKLIDMRIPFFQGIKGQLQDRELDGDTIVHMPFLEQELHNSEHRSMDLVDAQQDSLQNIFSRISDILTLDVFSTDEFDEQMDSAKNKREETISHVEELDGWLTEEYKGFIMQESMVVGLYQELLNASTQGETISPMYFDSQAYKSSDVYQLREESQQLRDSYVEAKAQEVEDRQVQQEAEALENRSWLEKIWDGFGTIAGEFSGYNDSQRAATGVDPVTGKELSEAERVTAGAMAAAGFIPVVGWAGRAFRGGKAVFQIGKAGRAADHALDAYKSTQGMDVLRKTEYGIYGLASANGFSEYITGKDMFGNALSEAERVNSLQYSIIGPFYKRGLNNRVADEVVGVSGGKKTYDRVSGVDGKGTGKSVTKVNYGEHFTKVDGKKALKSNIEYTTKEGYHYKTDSNGRITNVEAKLQLGKADRNQYAQRTVGRKDRQLTDDGGHLIANIFKGSGDIDNLVPMNATLNRSEYKTLENTWKKALEEGKEVTVKVRPIYEEAVVRPSEFKINYSIDGKKYSDRLTNYTGGK